MAQTFRFSISRAQEGETKEAIKAVNSLLLLFVGYVAGPLADTFTLSLSERPWGKA